jgi:hypothetical protein
MSALEALVLAGKGLNAFSVLFAAALVSYVENTLIGNDKIDDTEPVNKVL